MLLHCCFDRIIKRGNGSSITWRRCSATAAWNTDDDDLHQRPLPFGQPLRGWSHHHVTPRKMCESQSTFGWSQIHWAGILHRKVLMLSASVVDTRFAEWHTFFLLPGGECGNSAGHSLLQRTWSSSKGQGCVAEPKFTLGTQVNILSILPFWGCAFSYCDNEKIYRTKTKVWD